MTVSLRVHFKDEVEMMQWFEDIKRAGGFGSMPHPEFPDHVDVPFTDVGVRRVDSLDDRKIKGSKEYIVSGTKDPGRWVKLKEEEMLPAHTIIVNE